MSRVRIAFAVVRFLVLAASLACASGAHQFAAVPDCRSRPTWCQDGHTCQPTACATRSTVALEQLGAQLVACRAEKPRWFRPFVEAGGTWSPVDQTAGAYGLAGVMVWRLQFAAEVTQDDIALRAGYRREW